MNKKTIKDIVSLLELTCDITNISLILHELKKDYLFDKKTRQVIANTLMLEKFINRPLSDLEEFVAKNNTHSFSIAITGVNEVLWAHGPIASDKAPVFVHLNEDKKGIRTISSLSFSFE